MTPASKSIFPNGCHPSIFWVPNVPAESRR